MVKENKKLKLNNQPLLTRSPKPLDPFDLIGGTSTGGALRASWFKRNAFPLILHYRIIALMFGRLQVDVETAIQHWYSGQIRLLSSEGNARGWKVQSDKTPSSNQDHYEGRNWWFRITVCWNLAQWNPSRVDYLSVSCIYGFILQEYVLVIILIMSILSNIRVCRGVPDCIPNTVIGTKCVYRLPGVSIKLL